MLNRSILAVGIFTMLTTTASAQNLSGTWVSSDGVEHKITHSGNSIQGPAWGGPSNPDLRGTFSATGGPKEFRGTYQNQKADFKGSGSIVFTVTDNNTIKIAWQGFVIHKDKKAPTSGMIISIRKQPVDPLNGNWSQSGPVGNSTVHFHRRNDGEYDFTENGLGNARGTATLKGDVLTIQWRTANGQYEGISTYRVSGNSAAGSFTWTRKPANDNRPPTQSSNLRRN